MKRTIAIKLPITASQKEPLCELQDLFTIACNQVSTKAFFAKERNRIRLHHLSYRSLRQALPNLGAQMCCNAIAKVSAALKARTEPKELVFKKRSSVHFDKRTYSLKNSILSLFTPRGRIQIPLEISAYHKQFLEFGLPKEAELVYRANEWFFHLVLDLPDVLPIEGDKAIGVDLGENVLAATSTGKLFGGGALRA